MKKKSIKNNRINEEVLRGISEIIRGELKDPRVAEFTSVLSVEVAPDLKTAKVYISVLGSEEDSEKTLEGLRAGAGHIRSLLAKKINLRNTPQLYFLCNDSISYGIKMSRLIDEVCKDDKDQY